MYQITVILISYTENIFDISSFNRSVIEAFILFWVLCNVICQKSEGLKTYY